MGDLAMRRTTRSVVVLIALAAGMMLAMASMALGQVDEEVPVDGGTTVLSISSSTANTLANNGIGISRISPATTSGGTRFNFPIVGGTIVPTTGVGTVRHSGGLAIQSADNPNTLRLRNFVANTESLRISAQVGSSSKRVTFGRISLANAAVIRRGPGDVGTYIVRAQLILTRGGANAVNGFFGRNLPLAGLNLGRIDLRILPGEVLLSGGDTTLTPADSLIPSLAGLGVSLGNLPPVAANTAGQLVIPVSEGSWVVEQGTLVGDVEHEGGISLTGANGAPSLTLTEFDINSDVDTGPRVLAEVNSGTEANVIAVDSSSAKFGLSNGFLVIIGLDNGTFTDAATTALRATFGDSVPANLAVGSFRVKAKVV